MKLRLQSEKRSPEGGINGSGARRMMGRPEMAPLTLSIREAIQNSWDQRLQNGSTTTISFDWRSCSPAEDRFLREFVFQEWPSEGLSPLPEDTFSLLVISDRNTKGLNGPLFADEYEAGETDFNFVRFFRNVGRDRSQGVGGGTYGYGKATLYDLSRMFAIVAYSRFLSRDGTYISRFMAAALGDEFIHTSECRAENFTGRHWWGALDSMGKAVPIEGQAADRAAAELGIPGFSGCDTGTTVAVINPSNGGEEGVDQVHAESNPGEWIASTGLSFAWAHLRLVPDTTNPYLKVSVTCDGRDVPVGPLAGDERRTKAFSRSLECLLGLRHEDASTKITLIECHNPKMALGRLAITTFAAGAVPREGLRMREAAHLPFHDDCHHVALMRNPMLTVTYRPGPSPSVAGVGYAAVFLANPGLDTEFADAEPAAHDSWSWSDMQSGNGKTFVKTALKRIDEALRNSFVAGSPAHSGIADQAGLGDFMGFMAGLAPDSPGSGGLIPFGSGSGGARGSGVARKPATGKGSQRSSSGPWLDPAITSRIDLQEGQRVCVVKFKVNDIAKGTLVNAHGNVLLDEGDNSETEKESAGLETPILLGWRALGDASGGSLITSSYLELNEGDCEDWEVLLTIPEDTLIDVELVLRKGAVEDPA